MIVFRYTCSSPYDIKYHETSFILLILHKYPHKNGLDSRGLARDEKDPPAMTHSAQGHKSALYFRILVERECDAE